MAIIPQSALLFTTCQLPGPLPLLLLLRANELVALCVELQGSRSRLSLRASSTTSSTFPELVTSTSPILLQTTGIGSNTDSPDDSFEDFCK